MSRGPLIHVRGLHGVLESFCQSGNEGVREKVVVLGSTNRVEPVEDLLDHLIGGDELTDWRSRSVDRWPFVVPVIGCVATSGRGKVTCDLIDLGHIAPIADAETMAAVGLRVE